MITIEQLKRLNKAENITLTEHARIRLFERSINIDDIVNGINTREIIAQYPDDKPLASCLILGFSLKTEYIHIVVSCDTDFIYLITAYFPDPDVWENNFKARKKEGMSIMLCMECGAKAEKGYTTTVTDLGNCLLIVRNVPCYKCTECNEIIYTGDVVKRLEQITEQAKQFTQEISIVNYSSAA